MNFMFVGCNQFWFSMVMIGHSTNRLVRIRPRLHILPPWVLCLSKQILVQCTEVNILRNILDMMMLITLHIKHQFIQKKLPEPYAKMPCWRGKGSFSSLKGEVPRNKVKIRL